MAIRRSNKGVTVDMDALIAASSSRSRAVGNMGVNAKGDVVGAGGEIVKKNEDRVRQYYKNNPKSSTAKASLKGEAPSAKQLTPDVDPGDMAPKTAKTAKAEVTAEAVRQREQDIRDELQQPVSEPDEFDAPDGIEPLGYKEVELPNGDIEMVPYYKEEDE